MNTAENFFIVALLFRLLFPCAKYCVKCGVALGVCLAAFISIMPENSPFIPILYICLQLSAVWTIWWHIRFLVRLVKKDKTWGILLRKRQNQNQYSEVQSEHRE